MLNETTLIQDWKHVHQREFLFRSIVSTYQKPVYYFVRRMVKTHESADDVIQETFIKVWNKLDQFEGQSKLSTWIHTIAYRESLNHLERESKQMRIIRDMPARNAQEHGSVLDGDAVVHVLNNAVQGLPEKQKAVFILKYYENKKYEEIAAITGTSVGALKATYHHAVQKIEKQLARILP
jgi:RNA polymerase sigma-70 factor (ECF subfamily)